MKKNIGTQDRLIRALVGIVALGLSWWFSSWLFFAVALFSFYEAAVGWCALYQLLGKNSCPL